MEKLTLEYLAPFLPYRLKMFNPHQYKRLGKDYIPTTLRMLSNDKLLFVGKNVHSEHINETKYLPVLRPRDLTKPIQVDGKEVIPIVEMSIYKDFKVVNIISDIKKYTVVFEVSGVDFQYSVYKDGSTLSLREAKWLYANKFDLEGLIDAGLAIDVNTLETNPYNT